MSDKRLKLVRDIPEFSSKYDEKQDKFDHKVYADTLINVINNNEAPLVIGLLGGWGSGKSTILNIFSNKISPSHKVVYFNAWKYGQDSFRRQFLIETAKTLARNDKERDEFIANFGTRFYKEINKKRLITLKDIRRAFRELPNKIPFFVKCIAVFPILFIGAVFIFGWINKNSWLIGMSLVGLFPLPKIIEKIINSLWSGAFKMEIDPKIVLPEHFEQEFLNLVKNADEEIVFVIDDIDRCPNEKIMEILDSAKTFFSSNSDNADGLGRCYFILAMDEEAIVSALENNRSTKYRAEQILKFVDVNIRLASLSHADLIEFSKNVARETGITEEVVQIAIYGGFDTPRKIKHFLNSFKVIYSVAKQREDEKVFNLDVDQSVSSIAKVLVLQMAFPVEFDELLADFKNLENWEKKSYTVFDGGNNLGKDDNENLLKFLWTTRDTKIIDVEALLHLKIPSYALNLPNYSEIKESILDGNLKDIRALTKAIEDDAKEPILELIHDILEIKQPTAKFLSNALAASLEIYGLIDFDEAKKKRLSRIIIRHLIKCKEVLHFDTNKMFEIIGNLSQGETDRSTLIDIGIKDIDRKPAPENTGKFVTALIKRGEINSKPVYAKQINDSLEKLAQEDAKWVVDILSFINYGESKWEKERNKIPASKLINEKLIPLFDVNNEETEFYNKLLNVVLAYWDESYLAALSEKCLNAFRHWNQKTIKSINKNIGLMQRIIKEIPDWLEEKSGELIATEVWRLYSNNTNADEKETLLETYSIAISTSPSSKNAISEIAQEVKAYNYNNFRKFFKFVDEYEEEEGWWIELRTSVVNELLSHISGNLNEENLEKFRFLHSERKYELDDAQVTMILDQILISSQSIDMWKSVILEIVKKPSLMTWVCNKLKELIVKNYPIEHRKQLLDLFIYLVENGEDINKRGELGNYIFTIAKKVDDAELFGLGINNISKSKELFSSAFKTKLNSELQEICSKEADEVVNYDRLIDEFIEYVDEWYVETLKIFIDVIIRLVNANNTTYLEIAIKYLQGIKQIPDDKIEDLRNTANFIQDDEKKQIWSSLLEQKEIRGVESSQVASSDV